MQTRVRNIREISKKLAGLFLIRYLQKTANNCLETDPDRRRSLPGTPVWVMRRLAKRMFHTHRGPSVLSAPRIPRQST